MQVNIGIPVYNGGSTLGRVLESVIGQFPNKRSIYVLDDGSVDHSARVAFMRGVRVISHMRNIGLAHARNSILTHSDCEILIYFDADAAPRPGCIDALLEPFEDPKVVAVGGRGHENDCKTRSARWRAKRTPQSHGDNRINDDWMLMGLCVAFRRQSLLEVGAFDSGFTEAGEDVDVSLRLRQKGGRLVYQPKAIVDHLPSGDLYDVTRQAYTHSKFASYALMKNGKIPADYAIDSAKCLVWGSIEDLKARKIADCGVGAVNFVARSLGIAAGMAKAGKDKLLQTNRV